MLIFWNDRIAQEKSLKKWFQVALDQEPFVALLFVY